MSHNPDDLEFAVASIAERLEETKDAQKQMIRELIQSQGLEWVQSMVEESGRLRAEGKLRKHNKTPRTVGGAFFRLVKKRLGLEVCRVIMPSDQAYREARKEAGKARTAARKARKKKRRSALFLAQQALMKTLKGNLETVEALERAYRAEHKPHESPERFVIRRCRERMEAQKSA